MKCFFILFIFLFATMSHGAEFQSKKPVRILELNETTLLENVWPGMTTKQAVQILGQPEEVLNVMGHCNIYSKSEGDPAIRYGIYWLIPALDGSQIECIANQRGIKTKKGHICDCSRVIKKHILKIQN